MIERSESAKRFGDRGDFVALAGCLPVAHVRVLDATHIREGNVVFVRRSLCRPLLPVLASEGPTFRQRSVKPSTAPAGWTFLPVAGGRPPTERSPPGTLPV